MLAGLASPAIGARYDTTFVSSDEPDTSNLAHITSAMSADGSVVAFTRGTPSTSSLYVRATASASTELVSRAGGADGAPANGLSHSAALSRDGRFVAFISEATNLSFGDTDTQPDVYLRDRLLFTTVLVTKAPGPASLPDMSADGRWITFTSRVTSGDPPVEQDRVYLWDVNQGALRLIASDASDSSVSDDGFRVAFASTATNLHADDSDADSDVYVRDRLFETTILASRGSAPTQAKANKPSSGPDLSSDGRIVAFSTGATNLDQFDTSGGPDVYVRDIAVQTTSWISQPLDLGRDISYAARTGGAVLSLDGRYVAFTTDDERLTETSRQYRVIFHDRQTGTTEIVSRLTGKGGDIASGENGGTVLSADGRFVAWTQWDTNRAIDPADNDGLHDVYLRDVLGPPDRDGDGRTDDVDACPDQNASGRDADRDGCLDPLPRGDRDGDGLFDDQDACPDQAARDTDGCPDQPPPPKPDADSDGDGLLDSKDACPREDARKRDAKRNGCLDLVKLTGAKVTLQPGRLMKGRYLKVIRIKGGQRAFKALGVRVRKVSVSVLPAGATVSIRCTRRACRPQTIKAGKRKVVTFTTLRNREIGIGTEVSVSITVPGTVGYRKTYRAVANDTRPTEYCLRPGTTKPGSCSVER